MESHAEQARVNFAHAVRNPDAGIDLFSACMFIAAEEYPGLDIPSYAARIDSLADIARDRLAGDVTDYDRLDAVREVLFEIAGLRGNSGNFYDPRNSYLNDVIDRGLGIPITLSVIYREIAGRIGLVMRGVGIPGHFLLTTGSGSSEIFVDPYHHGGLLTRRECLALAMRGKTTGGSEPDALARHMLPINGNRSTLRRLLTNLKLTHAKKRDYRRSLAAAERIQLLDPHNWRNLSDLARLQAEIGDFVRAVESLSAYLNLAPEGTNNKRAQDALSQLRELARKQATVEPNIP
jgi:regulator of sirC expression with transglutaminase-like and TPR domain